MIIDNPRIRPLRHDEILRTKFNRGPSDTRQGEDLLGRRIHPGDVERRTRRVKPVGT